MASNTQNEPKSAEQIERDQEALNKVLSAEIERLTLHFYREGGSTKELMVKVMTGLLTSKVRGHIKDQLNYLSTLTPAQLDEFVEQCIVGAAEAMSHKEDAKPEKDDTSGVESKGKSQVG